MALRVKYAGYPVERIAIKSNLKEAIEHITSLESEVVYLFSTYSALFKCRKILERMSDVRDRKPEAESMRSEG